ELDAKVRELDQKWTGSAMPFAERETVMREKGKQALQDHWQVALEQAGYGFLRTLFGTGRETLFRTVGTKEGQLSPLWHTFIPLAQLALLYGLGAIGILCAFRRTYTNPIVSRNILFLFSVAIFLSLIPSASPVGYSRFRVHVVPMICF